MKFHILPLLLLLITLGLIACDRQTNINEPILNQIGNLIVPEEADNDPSIPSTQASDPNQERPGLPKKINLGLEHWAGSAPWIIADHRDMFRQHGVDPDLYFFTESTQMHRALVREQVDLIATPLSTASQLKAQIQDLKVLYLLQKSQSADVILSNDKIKNLRQLKGARVAYTLDSPGMILLEEVLTGHGLTRDDLNPVLTSQERALQLFIEGKVDVVVLRLPWLPGPGDINREKPRLPFQPTLLFSATNSSDRLVYGLIASEAKLLSHEKAMRGLVYAWHDAVNYIEQYPEESALILMETWKISKRDAMTALDAVLNYRIQDNLLRYNRMTPALLTLRLREAAKQHDSLKELDGNSMMTPIILKKELQQGPPPPPATQAVNHDTLDDFDLTYLNMVRVCELKEAQAKQLRKRLDAQRKELKAKRANWDQLRELLTLQLNENREAENHEGIAQALQGLTQIRKDQKQLALEHRQAALKLLNETQKKAWLAHELRVIIHSGLKQQKIILSSMLATRLEKNIDALANMSLHPERESERDKILFRIRAWLAQEINKEKATAHTEGQAQ